MSYRTTWYIVVHSASTIRRSTALRVTRRRQNNTHKHGAKYNTLKHDGQGKTTRTSKSKNYTIIYYLVIYHPAPPCAFSFFRILPTIVLHLNWSIRWLFSPGMMRSFDARSNIFCTLPKARSVVLLQALLAFDSM